jgi:hypothetical protein
MDAELVFDDEYPVSGSAIAYVVIWKLPRKRPGSEHFYKYRLSLVDDGVNILRYDNEAGKGDHRHVGRREFAYRFVDIDELRMDFWKDVEEWLRTKSGL